MNAVPLTDDEKARRIAPRFLMQLSATVTVDKERAERVANRYIARMKRLSRKRRKEEKRRLGFKLAACINVSFPFRYAKD